jgi:hypothetical protein
MIPIYLIIDKTSSVQRLVNIVILFESFHGLMVNKCAEDTQNKVLDDDTNKEATLPPYIINVSFTLEMLKGTKVRESFSNESPVSNNLQVITSPKFIPTRSLMSQMTVNSKASSARQRKRLIVALPIKTQASQ